MKKLIDIEPDELIQFEEQTSIKPNIGALLTFYAIRIFLIVIGLILFALILDEV
jgi:hypothetical protein